MGFIRFLSGIILISFCLCIALPARQSFAQWEEYIKQRGEPEAPEAEEEQDLDTLVGRPKKDPPLTQPLIQQLAQRLQIAPNSRFMQRIVEAYNQRHDHIEESDDVEAPLPKIVKHLRGQEGIPLPAKLEVRLPIKWDEEAQKQIVERLTREIEQGVEQIKKMYSSVPTLPVCSEDKTTQEATQYKNPKDGKTLLFDMVFIRKEDVPVDADEAFGKRTIIQRYDTSEPNPVAYSTLGAGIKCLPSRIRVTKEFVFRDEGMNALMNYEKDPHGKGVLHNSVNVKVALLDHGGTR